MNIRDMNDLNTFKSSWQIGKGQWYSFKLVPVFVSKSINQRSKQTTTCNKTQPAQECGSGNAGAFLHSLPFCVGKKQFSGSPLNTSADIINQKENGGYYFGKEQPCDDCKNGSTQQF